MSKKNVKNEPSLKLLTRILCKVVFTKKRKNLIVTKKTKKIHFGRAVEESKWSSYGFYIGSIDFYMRQDSKNVLMGVWWPYY